MARSLTILLLASAALLSLAAQLAERRIDFENHEIGEPPRFMTSAVTGDFKEGKWIVEPSEGAPSGENVLAQRDADDTEHRYALCTVDGERTADIDAEVQFKAIAGEVDQAGGIVVRYIDRNDYYLARANALEDNVRLYSVVQGKRTQLAGQGVTVAPNEWHKLRLVIQGRQLQVYFNDVMLFEAADDAHRDPGQVGLWTKADSITLFDDLVIKAVQQPEKK
ncbi:MAG TPA: family 16 glycoside hydrolase [Tepidisphaeraceae bacterium]|nr:family 16 glycoside hydrolase [Tepidisphaeraceae bacterium]